MRGGRMMSKASGARGSWSDLGALSRCLPYLKPFVKLLAAASILLLAASMLQLTTPLLTGYIIDQVLLGKKSSALHWIVPLLFLLTAAFLSANLFRSYLLARLKVRLSLRLHQQLLRRVSQLSFTYAAKKETGYLASRVLDDPSHVYEFATTQVLSLLQDVLTLIAALAAMAWLSWQTALLSLLIIPLYLFIGSRFVRRLRHLNSQAMEGHAQRNRILHETLAGLYTINACAAESQMLQRFLRSQLVVVRTQLSQFWLSSKVSMMRSFVAASGPLIVLWYGGSLVIEGRLTVGELVAFSAIFGYLFNSAQSLSAMQLSVQQVVVALERMFEILDEEPTVHEAADCLELPPLERSIEFRDVSFRYTPESQALQGVSLSIPAGKTIALVGRSGAGKTTITHLLMRFYDPQSGCILLDGKDLRTFSLRSLRSKIALVPQDVFLFSMSIEDNIRLGTPSASHSEVTGASRLAHAHAFIQKQPHGYQTPAGERGQSLSGGERQRIAIARALMKDPQVLILDEAVSAVDGTSEQRICETVRQLNRVRGITSIVIAHRLSTIQQADLIYLIEDGRIAANGSHQELVHSSPAYLDLIRFQYSNGGSSAELKLAQAG